jgi:hypothetical protein
MVLLSRFEDFFFFFLSFQKSCRIHTLSLSLPFYYYYYYFQQRFASSSVTQVSGSLNAYTISYSLVSAGNYSVSVLFNGSPLLSQQPPFIVVTPLGTVASQCTLSLFNTPVAGYPVYLTLTARDVFGNAQIYNELSSFGVVATNLLYVSLLICFYNYVLSLSVCLTNTVLLLGIRKPSSVPFKSPQLREFTT